MVLINTVTVEAINTALIALQRGENITIGGEKSGTVNNISVTNNGTGSGTDVSPQLNALDKRVTEVENENERQNERIAGLEGLGIESLEFEEGSRTLFIYLVNGDVLDVVIPDSPLTLSLNGTTLTLSSDGQTLSNVELPFIPSSEKGVANGVATLDSTGRIPYSQLPESAMEFKGPWNASTNDPHLEDGTGTNGDFYVCTMPGTTTFGPGNTVSFIQNDRVIYDGSTSKWIKLLAGQVSTVNGMSGDVVLNGTNVNYSDAVNSPTLKNKIDAIETMADTQVDWNESNSSSLAYIKNKPTIPAAQVQSDWTQTDNTQKDFIKHKIPIWIVSGASGSDMTPVDNITDGQMRPPTSNAVYDAISQITETNIIYDTSITDCNNAFQKGKSVTYCLSSTASNIPNSDNGWYILSQCNPATWSANNYIFQIATPSTNKDTNEVYTRRAYFNNSNVYTWTPWVRLYRNSDLTSYEKAFTLSSPQWIKVCTFGYRNYGEILEVKVVSNYAHIPSASHIIRIAYGWLDFTVEDIASDGSSVFDKIRVCWNSNNTDEMALFVHYNSSLANGMHWKTEGLAFRVSKVYAVNADPTTYANYKEYNLRTGGSLNGQRFTVTPNVYSTELDRNSESDRISAMSVLTVDRGNSGIGTIRYSGGYYYYYSWNITTGSEETIIETNPYNGTINIFKKDGTNTISRIRTI